MTTPTAAPMMVSRARRQPRLCVLADTAVRTTRTLMGICLADEDGSRSTSWPMPSDAPDDQGDGEGVQGKGIADGQREEHAEHHRRAALERRADRRPHRDLYDHDGGQRSEDGVGHPRDRARRPPREARGQAGLGHRGDLGRRRRCPRDGVPEALPQPPQTMARNMGRLGRHGWRSYRPARSPGHAANRTRGRGRRWPASLVGWRPARDRARAGATACLGARWARWVRTVRALASRW